MLLFERCSMLSSCVYNVAAILHGTKDTTQRLRLCLTFTCVCTSNAVFIIICVFNRKYYTCGFRIWVMFWWGQAHTLNQITLHFACSSHLNLQANKIMMLILNTHPHIYTRTHAHAHTHKTICLINHANPITFHENDCKWQKVIMFLKCCIFETWIHVASPIRI